MKTPDLNQRIAQHYLPQIAMPLKFGENGVFFWFPGSGMTTILKDIFTNKGLLKSHLGKLASQLHVTEFFGHLADKKDLVSLLNEAGFANYTELKESCLKLLDSGHEVVYLVGRIDDFTESERVRILKTFVKLNSLNSRRVHILYHSIDKPWFVKALTDHPELMVLANRMEIVPMLAGDLLKLYIQQRAEEYGYKVSEEEYRRVAETYGGVLQLSKEYLRSQGNTSLIELKLKLLWDKLPKAYLEALEQALAGEPVKRKSTAISDLEQLGILGLSLFEAHKGILNIDSAQILGRTLTSEEIALWNHCKRHPSQLISKDMVTDLLRPEQSDTLSFWALDKAISRFRTKLAKSGVDPEIFKTVKGKGYIWQS